jgi:Cu2+-exporting ATPase
MNERHKGHRHEGEMQHDHHMADEHAHHHPPAAGTTEGQKHHHMEHGHAGHDHSMHHRMMIQDFKRRFIVCLILTVPILLLSPMIQKGLGFSLQFTGSLYVLFALSTFVFFYGGWPFLKGLFQELGNKAPGMMTLIALAISVAYFYSAIVVFGVRGKIFFWELVTLIDIMLLGHFIEMKSVLGASRALDQLARLLPSEAHRVQGDQITDVKISDLKPGDLILVKPGERFAADGLVAKGESFADESVLTGESRPVKKKPEDKVIAGAINGEGSLTVKIEKTGKDSYLSRIIELVNQAQTAKSKTQRLADRAAFWLTLIALTAGSVTLVVWLILGSVFSFALERMVTVMVITCPHALGLAIPLVVAVSTALAARSGLLIRNRTAFENSRKITTVVFDKTGTLTEGKFGVSRIIPLKDNLAEEKILRYASALEQNSEHPIASSIVRKAKEQGVEIPTAAEFKSVRGKGVEGRVEDKPVKVVSAAYLKENGIQVGGDVQAEEAETQVFLLVGNQPAAMIGLSDQIRPESYPAVRKLKSAGIKCMMLTGDNQKVAKSVAEKLGLDGYFAEVLPHQKLDKVKELQAKGEFVAMTGDGVNDAPALAQADVGIAIGAGTDVAAETADIILVNSNPQDVSTLILFGRATYGKMVQNLIWATGYNAFAIPLAAGVLYSVGVVISPAVGALLMSVSTVIVAVNARLLKVRSGR